MEAFDQYQIVAVQLVDIRHIELHNRKLGIDLEWPVFLAPAVCRAFFTTTPSLRSRARSPRLEPFTRCRR
jgi:isopentenyl diphosphate isomerase/L-lactate dehydrogenase-like FMN-dependent dehydrogenase